MLIEGNTRVFPILACSCILFLSHEWSSSSEVIALRAGILVMEVDSSSGWSHFLEYPLLLKEKQQSWYVTGLKLSRLFLMVVVQWTLHHCLNLSSCLRSSKSKTLISEVVVLVRRIYLVRRRTVEVEEVESVCGSIHGGGLAGLLINLLASIWL